MLAYITGALPKPVTPPLALVEEAMRLVELKDAPIVAAARLVKADYLASYEDDNCWQNGQKSKRLTGL